MTIRPATKNDAPALMDLLKQLGYTASKEECIKRIRQHSQEFYHLAVGEVEGAVIGFIALHWYQAFHHPRPIGRVVAFCVDEKFRRNGWGTTMLHYAESLFISKQCFKIELTSNLKRHDSHAYYLKLGYQQTSMHLVRFLA